jgi:uncharacterized repeat protein (TIGR01451 family)
VNLKSVKKLIKISPALLSFVFILALGINAANVSAGVPQLANTIKVIQDGSDAFDLTTWNGINNNPTQGTDENSNNGMVRVMDIVTYEIEISVNGNDMTNVVSTINLGANQDVTVIPTECLKNPPASPVSSISTDKHVLTCNIGDQPRGTKILVRVTALVNGDTANGDKVKASVSTLADGVSPASSFDSGEVTATETFKLDLVKANVEDGAGIVHNSGANGPAGEDGHIIEYDISAFLEKGSDLPANVAGMSSFSILDRLDYTYPVTENWRLYDWGSSAPCYDTSSVIGSISCSQPGVAGDLSINLSSVDISNIDSSLKVFSFRVKIWIPDSDVVATGSTTLGLFNHVEFNPSPLSENGYLNYGSGNELNMFNNDALSNLNTVSGGGFCYSASFEGVIHPGCSGDKSGSRTLSAGQTLFQPVSDGASSDVYNFQVKSLNLSGGSFSSPASVGKNMIICEKIDTSKMEFYGFTKIGDFVNDGMLAGFGGGHVVSPDYPMAFRVFGYSGDYRKYTDDGFNAAITGVAFWPFGPTGVEAPIIEYSTAANGSGNDAAVQAKTCDNPADNWSTTAPANLADVTMVRIKSKGTAVPTSVYEDNLSASINVKMKPSLNPGDIVPNYSHIAFSDGTFSTYDVQQPDDFDAAYSTLGNPNYGYNSTGVDRITIVSARMNINKAATSAPTGAINAGDTVDYRITPVINGGQPAVDGVNFTITDTLPVGMTYIPGSATILGSNGIYSPVEPTISGPSLEWTLNGVTANEAVASINYKAVSNASLTNATLVNNVTISSDSVPLNEDNDTDGNNYNGFQGPTASAMVKISPTSGYHIYKTLPKILYRTDQSIDFSLNYVNRSAQDLSAGQIIDVLPFNEDSTSYPNAVKRENTFNPASTTSSLFTDTSTDGVPGLVGPVTTYNGETVEYALSTSGIVSKDINYDPCHVSNLPNGYIPSVGELCWDYYSTNGSLVGGPSGTGIVSWVPESSMTASDWENVLAVRISTTALPVGTEVRTIDMKINPIGNQHQDVYCNNFESRVPEISLFVESNSVCAMVLMAQVGDTVWYDIDRDGVQDPSELGIPNITLTLTGTDYGPDGVVGGGDDSPVSLTQVTDASGKYLFSGLGAGSYKVVATPPTGLDQTYDLDGIASANDSGSFSLAAGDNKLDVDFGYAGNAQAGDTVWYDIDRDGVQDPSELGIPNITLTLTGTDYGPDGVVGGGDDSPVSLTQVTDASGKYLFSGLGAGSYKVVATPPTGLDQTYDLDGIASANDSGSFSLAAGDNKLDVDFGYAGNAQAGDTVWYDIDRDGVQDPSELGIPNITLTLTGTDYGPDGVVGGGDDSPVSLTQVTDASGKYLFSGLGAGSYKVVATPPTGLDQTYDLDGIASANDSGSFSLAAGDNKLDVDFGYAGNAQAGDTVWYDIDRDGVQDPSELGIPNITLTLTGTDYGPDGVVGGGDDSPVSLTQVTDASGKYLFSGLGAGSYKVVATPPTGLDQTYDLDGIASANDSGSFSLAAGDNKLDVDFGYAGNAQAGDTVWYDIDRDGVQDPSELGIPNITLTLTGTDYGPDGVVGGGDDSPVSLTQVTDASGKYLFSGLGAGSYKVVATPPTGLDQTYDLDGIASANDSGSFSLAAGDNKLDVDFGYAGNAQAGDTVWYDIDRDGVQDPSELGIPNITLTLTGTDYGPDGVVGGGDDSPVSLTQVTDASGKYLFSGLGAGSYKVVATPPTGLDQTYDLDGIASANDSGSFSLAAGDNKLDVDFGYAGIDDDNDGILNTDEDTNNDGNPTNDDTDGDGTPNYLDLDSDGDGVNDIVEAGGIDADNNGLVDSTTDTDGDGLADTFDPDNGGTALALIDTDGDGNINAYDIDDDNDGILNTDEDTNNDGNPANDDVDGDGTPNYLDLDSDGDGVSDKDEITNGTNPYVKEAITTVVEESKPVITTNKDPIASTGENTKIIIAGATILILGAVGVMVVRRKK